MNPDPIAGARAADPYSTVLMRAVVMAASGRKGIMRRKLAGRGS
jgi:hypothetical protein